MALIKDLLEKGANLSTASKYTAMSGFICIGGGVLLIVWPGVVRTLFMDQAFVDHEAGIIRMVGLTPLVVGGYFLFGGRSGARQLVAASAIERIVFVPAVLVPQAMASVFPHLLGVFAILDPALAIGAWVPLGRKT